MKALHRLQDKVAVITGSTKGIGRVIMNISSMASWRALKSQPAYSASKAALNALNRQVAIDYAKDNIRSNAIIIGFVLSGERSLRLANDPVVGPGLRAMSLLRMGTSEDVAYAALFLASDEAGFITGIEMPVDGGVLIRSHVPEYL
jgi:NAD(P)-dependent dehydrogenase (short-subunit alcohol dehydrogenase family)